MTTETTLRFPGLLGDAHETAVFEPFKPGVEISHLKRTENGAGPGLALLRYAPGARVPLHEHVGLETICVLAGSQSDEAGTYRSGDVVVNLPGSRHRVWSDEGCTILISWAEPVRILEDD